MAESTNIANTLNVTNLNTTATVDAFGNIIVRHPTRLPPREIRG
jgi:hypothetical protein